MSQDIILIASEKRETQDLLAQALSRHNNSVRVAEGSTQAIAALNEHSVAVMILDYPLVRIQDVMLCVRRTQPNTSTICLLAPGNNIPPTDLVALGADDYLVKPLSPDLVRLAVARALQLRRSKHKAERLALAHQIGLQMASILDEDQLLWEVVRLIRESFDLYYVGIALLEGNVVEIKAAASSDRDTLPPIGERHKLTENQEMITQAMHRGEPLVIADLQTLSPHTFPPELSEARSALVIPLVLQDRPLGALEVLSIEPHAFETDDVPLFESLAAQITAAVQNTRLFSAQQKHKDMLNLFNATAVAMQRVIASSRTKALEVMVNQLSHSGLVSLLHLLDPASDSAYLSYSSLPPHFTEALIGLLDTPPENWMLDMAHAPIYRRVLDERRAVFLLDIEALISEIVPVPLPNDRITSIAQDLGNPHAVIAPMFSGAQIMGWLTVFSSRLDTGDCPAVMAFANQAAMTLENARLLANTRHTVELVLLNEAGQAMAETLEFDEVLQLLLQSVAKAVQVNKCVVALWDEKKQRHVPRARLLERRVSLDDLIDGDAQTLDSLPPLHIPLLGQNRTLGLLALDRHSDGSELSAEDVQLIQALANQAASALENARLYTELKRSAEELERSQQRLIQSEKLAATGRLAASIAHEINNPLQAIKNCLELMIDEAEEGEPLDRTYLDVATSELERIRGIIQQMLDLYRPTREKMMSVNVNAALEGVLALLRNQLEGQHITVETQLDAATPHVMGHGDQIRQVFINLILNASEAMPEGGQLALKTHQHRDGFVTIQVIDNGAGIAPEDLSRIADPFFTTKSKGTGLGLTICHEIIERHQGRLDVTSQVGHGSTFTIQLPASE